MSRSKRLDGAEAAPCAPTGGTSSHHTSSCSFSCFSSSISYERSDGAAQPWQIPAVLREAYERIGDPGAGPFLFTCEHSTRELPEREPELALDLSADSWCTRICRRRSWCICAAFCRVSCGRTCAASRGSGPQVSLRAPVDLLGDAQADRVENRVGLDGYGSVRVQLPTSFQTFPPANLMAAESLGVRWFSRWL